MPRESKLIVRLRELKVYNDYEFAGRGNVFLSYSPNDYSRGGRSARWEVNRPGYKTDPTAHWQDNGCKVFCVFSKADRVSCLEKEAKPWCEKRYGIKKWARTPFGGWMDAEFVTKRLKELGVK